MRKNLIAAGLLICSVLVIQANGQKALRGLHLRSDIFGNCASPDLVLTKSNLSSGKTAISFDLSYINEATIKEFKKAWEVSGNGNWKVEGLVLLYGNSDGSYRAASLGTTNQDRKFTFTWSPDIIAIVHTHPNDRDRKPHDADKQIADKLGVPIFTITDRGMYMYDPKIKETIKVKDGLAWLDSSAWLH